MYRAFLFVLMVVLCPKATGAQTDERTAYQQAVGQTDPAQKIEALRAFLQQNPESRYRGNAYRAIFETQVETGDTSGAQQSMVAYLNGISAGNLPSAYNSVAWSLAEAGIGLDSAAVYAERAVAWARESNPRRLSMILDTQAYVRFKQGDAAAAEKIQLEAIEGHEKEADYLGRLAQYQHGAGRVREALHTLTTAMFYDDGSHDAFIGWFHEWSSAVESDAAKREAMTIGMVQTLIDSLLVDVDGKLRSRRLSRAVQLMSVTGVNLETARRWAEEAVANLSPNASASDRVAARRALGYAHLQSEQFARAIAALEPVVELASLWDVAFWYTLGQAYEKSGRDDDALFAYTQGALLRSHPTIQPALEALYKRHHGSTEGLEKHIADARKALENFDPGRYDGAPTGRVVLAELFTGAECPPCVAADYAFDALAKYYPRNMVALLEYHLHIPGPDPLTHEDTETRAKFYGVRSTPTAFFNGVEKIVGGGPKLATKSRFARYRESIRKQLDRRPNIRLEGSAELDDRVLRVKIKAMAQDLPDTSVIQFHAALAERSVAYVGGNGVDHHAFVVRDLLAGGVGEHPTFLNGVAQVQWHKSFSVIEEELNAHLDRFAENPPERYRSFKRWRDRPTAMNRDNLVVVAWIQNRETREILQSWVSNVK